MSVLPPAYRLLATMSGVPIMHVEALKRAGLWGEHQKPGAEHMTDEQRALLAHLVEQKRIRWVPWGPDGEGYVLTGTGEGVLSVYFNKYGPALTKREPLESK